MPSRKVSGAENRCQSKTYRAFTYDRVFGAQASDLEAPPYAKIKFELTDGVTMWFCDIRTFGTLYLVTDDDCYIAGYETLGPEPLTVGLILNIWLR